MLSKIFIHNFLKILLINFRFLPFRQAIKLPIDVYGKLRILSYKGSIRIESDNVRPGMIKLGSQGRDMFPTDAVIMDVRGTLVFKGPFYIGCGSTLRVEEGATLTIGAKSRIGACSLVFCESGITLGDNVGTSWKCQIMDTDRHEMRDTVSGKIYPSRAPIAIGSNVWIGNNVLINKGGGDFRQHNCCFVQLV